MKAWLFFVLTLCLPMVGCGTSASSAPTYTVEHAGEIATIYVNSRIGKMAIELPAVGKGTRRGTYTVNGRSMSYDIKYDQENGQLAIKSVVIDGKEVPPASP